MPAKGDRSIFLDTNVLVYANVAEAPLHQVAFDKIRNYRESGWDIWISNQVLREYLAIRTREQDFGELVPMGTLIERVRFFLSAFRVACETTVTLDNLLMLLRKIPIGGKQVHDANIVATMLELGVKSLLTHNVEDFRRYSALITVVPLVE